MLFQCSKDAEVAAAVSGLAYCNPFLPERIEFEQAVLGEDFVKGNAVWSLPADWAIDRPNIQMLKDRVEALAADLRKRLADGMSAGAVDVALYEDVVVYVLYYRVHDLFDLLTRGDSQRLSQVSREMYDTFAADCEHFLHVPGRTLPTGYQPHHLFACFFQVWRAFRHIFRNIVGTSMPAAKLRAAIWQSIFTHDMRRYRRVLYDRMADLTTLVTGPSGTGKELVAQAVALSRYIPFDARNYHFTSENHELFYPLNLSALSPTLIESELFGHRRGAFTGAAENRAGWLEVCPPLGSVFLDEIGELAPGIQVKLLRVLQTRMFQRLGDTKALRFRGKIIAATHRDLAREMAEGSFRKDFYYRICSDMIETPSLFDQLRDQPDDLHGMVLFIARHVAEEDAENLTDEVVRWVRKHLGREYPWPGNFRELEQCVSNILIRHEYRPPATSAADSGARLTEDFITGAMTADELLRRYCTLVYSRTRNLEETARRLGLDRRTIKAKVALTGNP